MVNMKMTAEEAKEYTSDVSPGDAPAYPWGLRICLDDDALAKLGMTEPPAVGVKLKVMAQVEVIRMGISQQQDGDKESSCELQITDMEIAPMVPEKDAATVLYGA